MKKLLVIPLMFLYMIAMIGIMVRAHYCGQQLVSWNIYLKANDCGDCGDDLGKPNATKCCKDKIVIAKVTHEQASISQKLQLHATSYVLLSDPLIHLEPRGAHFVGAVSPVHRANAPPGRWQQIPLYKLHSSLTYYG